MTASPPSSHPMPERTPEPSPENHPPAGPTPFQVYTARAVALRRDNIDTDQIVPAEFCKRVTKSGYADALFARWRKEPDFIVDRPEHRGAGVLLAGRNFGIGSSREHAVWALKDGGFRVVIATGFGDIFQRNAMNNGLLPVDQPLSVVELLMAEVERDPEREITVDLVNCRLTTGRHQGADGWDFAVNERARQLLLKGQDAISATLQRDASIARYEAGRPDWLPTLRPTD
ncbi:3-isopropylmalate dehydratase small subunit [Streptomyces noursei]|uniref:3-isopropylmalate dehydratase small subunit n=1 Tax=Streptomyces noursei TaxID=1971 RepID=UPI001F04EDA8|nr:3-isopropylmalate dehydratase small subunit [Streptomyces noursei]